MSQIVAHNSRLAIERAKLFLDKAKQCPVESRVDFEAFLEASIVFARAAIHRIKSQHETNPSFKAWWASMLQNPSVNFFRMERDWILKNGPPQIGQRIIMPAINIPTNAPIIDEQSSHNFYASELYYYEDPTIPATDTVSRHLVELESQIINFTKSIR